jgi:hypothetical protein
MLETLFASPWTLVAGGVLISSPIIIHLINRMRFRRIRWAAMEFLLKSQKRNRRRLIIEQLLLLLLRISLVLLAGLLLARFSGFSFAGLFQKQNLVHVVLLDDTASLQDQWKEEGQNHDSFTLAKRILLEKIARPATQASTIQSLQVITLSSPDQPFRLERLNADSLEELRTWLGDLKCSALHVDLLPGLERAQNILNDHRDQRRILHILSDFRSRDWAGTQADSLTPLLSGMSQAGVRVHLIDVAHPYRTETQKVALYHDNLGIVDLRPETRVAARAMPVQFTVTVTNFSASEKKNVRVTVKVNGGERAEGSLTMPTVPPGQSTATFSIFFDQLGFNQVTTSLENEEAGLQLDNIRYAVVEVRERVPVLVVEGDLAGSVKPGGDAYHLQALFDNVRGAARGFDLVLRGPSELEQPNLDQYPSIYLLNVRDLSDKAVANLENYIREGGGVAFFMGDRINPDFYNRKLYAEGKGVFPVPLAGRPYPPLSDDEMQPDLSGEQFQLFLRSETHPIFAEVYSFRGVFRFLPIKRYYPVPRSLWKPEPGKVEELATLPNRKSVKDYQDQTQAILDRLPIDDPKYAAYRPGLVEHQRNIRRILAGEPLYRLANALDLLLHDAGDPNNRGERPNLVEFWELAEMRRLRDQIDRFRQEVQYGDPLVVASRTGKGKVVVFLTSAGQRWNNWAGGSMPYVMATYPIVMIELQKYLTAAGADLNLTVGTPVDLQLDATRYQGRMRRFFWPEPKEAGARAAGTDAARSSGLIDKGEQSGSTGKDGKLTFVFDEAREPGVYLFQLQPKGEPGSEPRPEPRAVAFNVDTVAEGDLRRATKDELDSAAPAATLYGGQESELEVDLLQTADFSELPWLFLIGLVLLVAEQALAVRLSFHLKGTEAPPAPVATAA